MKSIEQIKSEEKARLVIESCKNDIHLEVAYNYLDLFLIKFKDKTAADELMETLWQKRKTIIAWA